MSAEWDSMSSSSVTELEPVVYSITDPAYTTTISSANIGMGTITSVDYSFEMSPSRDEFNTVVERLEKLEKVLSEEAELRSNHPALKNAYDEYRLLLVLSKA